MVRIYLMSLGLALNMLFNNACAHSTYRIQSEPSDAEVSVNGKKMGKTPLALPLEQLPHDRDTVLLLTKPGHSPTQFILPGSAAPLLSSTVIFKLSEQEDVVDKINRITTNLWRAQRLSGTGRYQEALKIADSLLSEEPRFVTAHLLKASILFLSKNLNEAQSEWAKVLEIEPANEEASRALRIIKNLTPENLREPASGDGGSAAMQ